MYPYLSILHLLYNSMLSQSLNLLHHKYHMLLPASYFSSLFFRKLTRLSHYHLSVYIFSSFLAPLKNNLPWKFKLDPSSYLSLCDFLKNKKHFVNLATIFFNACHIIEASSKGEI